jgi:hypothetical protein
MYLEDWRYVSGSQYFLHCEGDGFKLDTPFQMKEYIEKVSHRTVLDIELMLDIDDKKHNVLKFKSIHDKAEFIYFKLQEFGPSVYFTQSKSYHLGILDPTLRELSKEQRKRYREEFMKRAHLYSDFHLCSEDVTIALEGAIHYRSKKPKIKVKFDCGYNSQKLNLDLNEIRKDVIKEFEDRPETPIEYKEITECDETKFPPCIRNIKSGLADGKKRALFVVTNFLLKCGWSRENIEVWIKDWNQNNKSKYGEGLRDGMIKMHLDRHTKNNEKVLPPNCNNQAYYKTIGTETGCICKQDCICKKIKNPIQYVKVKNQ